MLSKYGRRMMWAIGLVLMAGLFGAGSAWAEEPPSGGNNGQQVLYIPNPNNPNQPMRFFILKGGGVPGINVLVTPPVQLPPAPPPPPPGQPPEPPPEPADTDPWSATTAMTVTLTDAAQDPEFELLLEQELNVTPEPPRNDSLPPLKLIELDEFKAAIMATFGDEGVFMLEAIENFKQNVGGNTYTATIVLEDMEDNTSFREDNTFFGSGIIFRIDNEIGDPNAQTHPRELGRMMQDFATLFSKPQSAINSALIGKLQTSYGKVLENHGRLTSARVDDDKFLDQWQQIRQQLVQDAATFTANAGHIYLQAMAFVAPGGLAAGVDMAFSVADLTEGHWTGALGLLPYLRLPESQAIRIYPKVKSGALCEFTAAQVKKLRQLVDNSNLTILDRCNLLRKTANITVDAVDSATRFLFCFPEGTFVKTEHGHRHIEDLRPGDLVWAWCEATGEKALKPVWGKEDFLAPEIVKLDLNCEGQEFSLRTTPNHPFYARHFGAAPAWRLAGDLEPGDELVTFAGKTTTLRGKLLSRRTTRVYSIAISGFSTYFVSEWDVLCHNNAQECAAQLTEKWLKKEVDVTNFLSMKWPKALAVKTEAEALEVLRTMLRTGTQKMPNPLKGKITDAFRRLKGGLHEFMPVNRLTTAANVAGSKKIFKETVELMNAVRTKTKDFIFDNAALRKTFSESAEAQKLLQNGRKAFGHAGSGASTKYFAYEFHKELDQAFDVCMKPTGLEHNQWLGLFKGTLERYVDPQTAKALFKEGYDNLAAALQKQGKTISFP